MSPLREKTTKHMALLSELSDRQREDIDAIIAEEKKKLQSGYLKQEAIWLVLQASWFGLTFGGIVFVQFGPLLMTVLDVTTAGFIWFLQILGTTLVLGVSYFFYAMSRTPE